MAFKALGCSRYAAITFVYFSVKSSFRLVPSQGLKAVKYR